MLMAALTARSAETMADALKRLGDISPARVRLQPYPATVENVDKLKSRGIEFIGPEEGMLACGYEGLGRLWKVDDIAFRAEFLLARQENLIA